MDSTPPNQVLLFTERQIAGCGAPLELPTEPLQLSRKHLILWEALPGLGQREERGKSKDKDIPTHVHKVVHSSEKPPSMILGWQETYPRAQSKEPPMVSQDGLSTCFPAKIQENSLQPQVFMEQFPEMLQVGLWETLQVWACCSHTLVPSHISQPSSIPKVRIWRGRFPSAPQSLETMGRS